MRLRCRVITFIQMATAAFTLADGASLTEVAKKVRPATLLLSVSRGSKPVASGTGFLISGDGLLVTNKHVILGGTQISARAENGNIYKVLGIMASAKDDDVVILKIEGANLPFLPLGDSEAVDVGERVAIVGSPLGLEGSLSEGIISAKRQFEGKRWLQITAAISPGSSGSPVVNADGEVIGIATLLIRGGQSLNFAVPSKVAKVLLPTDGKRPEIWPLANYVGEDTARMLSDPQFKRFFDVIDSGDHMKAISTLTALIEKYPLSTNTSWLQDMLMSQYEDIGFYDKVEPYRQQEVEHDPSNWWNWEKLADLYAKEQKYKAAITAFHQAVSWFERSGSPILSKGEAREISDLYRKAGDEEKAREWASRSQSLPLDPWHSLMDVKEGMERTQVEAILGRPTSQTTEDFETSKKTTYVYRGGYERSR